MILSFGDARTRRVYDGRRDRSLPAELHAVAWRKLDLLRRAHVLRDLRVPPGNRLEALKGKWKGFHSIRINEQWRIVFRWRDGDAEDVRILDYH